MASKIYIVGPRDPTPSALVVNTTSHAKGSWSLGLSPFIAGPVALYNGWSAKNVENGWQYSKVYAQHTDQAGDPTLEYFEWAQAGWRKFSADRYPMGKGAKPEYLFWDCEKLTYVEARIRVYFQLYRNAVRTTAAWHQLRAYHEAGYDLALWDFDGYNHDELELSLDHVLLDPNRKMGHAFVLKCMLLWGADVTPKLEHGELTWHNVARPFADEVHFQDVSF